MGYLSLISYLREGTSLREVVVPMTVEYRNGVQSSTISYSGITNDKDASSENIPFYLSSTGTLQEDRLSPLTKTV